MLYARLCVLYACMLSVPRRLASSGLDGVDSPGPPCSFCVSEHFSPPYLWDHMLFAATTVLSFCILLLTGLLLLHPSSLHSLFAATHIIALMLAALYINDFNHCSFLVAIVSSGFHTLQCIIIILQCILPVFHLPTSCTISLESFHTNDIGAKFASLVFCIILLLRFRLGSCSSP